MVLPFFAITLFVSAFCLFLVQPIIGKLILPKLGGTPQVWNTCMVFFQTALLAGYFYTHTVSTRLKLRHQLIVHGFLLLIPLLVLFPEPFSFPGWAPTFGDNPIPQTLVLLAKIVGIPFLVVATSAPLLQKWFAATGHSAAKDPYFLYGASNLGSLLALLVYPVAVEPWLDLRPQAWLFTGGYIVLMGLVLGCIAMVWKLSASFVPAVEPAHPEPTVTAPPASTAPESTAVTAAPAAKTTPPAGPVPPAAKTSPAATGMKKGAPKPGFKQPGKPGHAPADVSIQSNVMTTARRLRWIALAAVPSSFMLGITSHITTDLSPIPLFWLVPLSLYLLSFILVYSRWPVVWVEQPHRVVLYLQAIAVPLMIYFEVVIRDPGSQGLQTIVFFNVLAFFLTALMCHGELAKDRPGTQHLTEYFLLMSVGGMLGGMFNGLVAPLFFKGGVAEFPIAVFLACLVRPLMKDEGWLDAFLSGTLEPQHAAKAHAKGHKAAAPVEKTTSYAPLLDYVLPLAVLGLAFGLTAAIPGMFAQRTQGSLDATRVIAFGLPLIICCFFYGRHVRYGLAVGAVLLVQVFFENEGRGTTLLRDRSYFGIIRVMESYQDINISEGVKQRFYFTQLTHGHILHGQNFKIPSDEKDRGHPTKDFSRLATTYYHRRGPAGMVMEKFNWFKDPPNVYKSDTRICASMVGMNALTDSSFPLAALVDGWSEPPLATIGLGTGTMAAYGRPFQYVHYYEIDNHIRKISLPGPGDEKFGDGTPYFNYLRQAEKRGCNVEVLMGDARLRMAFPYMLMKVTTKEGTFRGEITAEDDKSITLVESLGYGKDGKPAQGRTRVIPRAEIQGKLERDKDFAGGPDNFYYMMVVDAFTSDAIPAHLITKQAISMYFDKLAKHDPSFFDRLAKDDPLAGKQHYAEGVLCVHTSNRFVALPKVVAAVAQSLDYAYQTGKDRGYDDPKASKGEDNSMLNVGRSGSEWVMVTRKADYFVPKVPPQYIESNAPAPQYWSTLPRAEPRYLWTDDHYNLLNIIRWGGREED